MINTAADLQLMLADFGQACVWAAAPGGARTAQVVVDAPARDFISGQVISTETTLTYASADLPALPSGAQLTLGGVLYQVREVHALDDGLISHATLAKV